MRTCQTTLACWRNASRLLGVELLGACSAVLDKVVGHSHSHGVSRVGATGRKRDAEDAGCAWVELVVGLWRKEMYITTYRTGLMSFSDIVELVVNS